MIKLTRLNGQEIIINADVIKFIEATPDSKITFLNNDIILVKEKVDQVLAKALVYKKLDNHGGYLESFVPVESADGPVEASANGSIDVKGK